MSYRVTAKRWEHGWELHIDEVGVTQSHTLSMAEAVVRSYLAMDELPDAHTARIDIVPELPGDLTGEVAAAREAARHAEQARDEAAERARKVVRDLKAAGLSGSDVAAVLKVSTQRVSQLLKQKAS